MCDIVKILYHFIFLFPRRSNPQPHYEISDFVDLAFNPAIWLILRIGLFALAWQGKYKKHTML